MLAFFVFCLAKWVIRPQHVKQRKSSDIAAKKAKFKIVLLFIL